MKMNKSSPKSCWQITQKKEVKNVNTRAGQAKEWRSSTEPWGRTGHVEAAIGSLASIIFYY